MYEHIAKETRAISQIRNCSCFIYMSKFNNFENNY